MIKIMTYIIQTSYPFERCAKDPAVPVIFDQMMNEYHLQHLDKKGHSGFYHCPFCSGKAPQSLRPTYWSEVSRKEMLRLQQLTKDIKTPDQLFATFGTLERLRDWRNLHQPWLKSRTIENNTRPATRRFSWPFRYSGY